MKIFQYDSYNDYVKIQTAHNIYKLNKKPGLHWIKGNEVDAIVNYIQKNIPNATFGICHGVRNGWEVEAFRKKLKINVIGTEISHTAVEFPNVIQWDFHKVKDEWVAGVDFIYSNSLDHSYDPEYCIDQWMSCLKKDGLCFIEWSVSDNKKANKVGCFCASENEYKSLFQKKYQVKDKLLLPKSTKGRCIFVIGNK